jgi:hypothetical protein
VRFPHILARNLINGSICTRLCQFRANKKNSLLSFLISKVYFFHQTTTWRRCFCCPINFLDFIIEYGKFDNEWIAWTRHFWGKSRILGRGDTERKKKWKRETWLRAGISSLENWKQSFVILQPRLNSQFTFFFFECKSLRTESAKKAFVRHVITPSVFTFARNEWNVVITIEADDFSWFQRVN